MQGEIHKDRGDPLNGRLAAQERDMPLGTIKVFDERFVNHAGVLAKAEHLVPAFYAHFGQGRRAGMDKDTARTIDVNDLRNAVGDQPAKHNASLVDVIDWSVGAICSREYRADWENLHCCRAFPPIALDWPGYQTVFWGYHQVHRRKPSVTEKPHRYQEAGNTSRGHWP
ncbi:MULTISPECIES: hypothetical protein [Alphaproteobacteria]|uniref:hypothetical protein n=1 Tax=Alphaproteobacteria TaxID=28211 RepID=UPI001F1BF710|nr:MULTISPECIES: hypothetical protein [Alphaproteobacteria]